MLTLCNMNDFLGYIKKRRVELHAELSELEIAERIYRSSGAQIAPSQRPLAFETPPLVRKSIKQMVIDILDDMHPHGLTALELLDQLRARWNVRVRRTSLSPQLTRLKNDHQIYNEHGVWKRLKETETPDVSDASEEITSAGVAG